MRASGGGVPEGLCADERLCLIPEGPLFCPPQLIFSAPAGRGFRVAPPIQETEAAVFHFRNAMGGLCALPITTELVCSCGLLQKLEHHSLRAGISFTTELSSSGVSDSPRGHPHNGKK